MKGKLKDLTFDRGGKQILSVEINADFSEEFDRLYESDIDIEIKKHHEKRSLDANAYCWVLINKIAKAIQHRPDEVYREAIRNVPDACDIICVKEEAFGSFARKWEKNGLGWQAEQFPSKIDGCVNVRCWCGSSVYDTAQMSALIDVLKQDAENLGIPVETETEINEMLSLWETERKK